MTTMKDVARETGLSLATVSRVFNQSDKVTEKTRKTVLKAAEKLNFRPNKMAAALRSGRSRTIGVVVPIIDNDVFSSAIKSMESYLKEAGYHIIISQSHESLEEEKKILENLLNLQVEGVIISVSKETTNMDHLKALNGQGTSVVLFDRRLESVEMNSVIINNFNGAFQATEHLIKEGYKKIVHLAGKESVSIFRERRKGFEAAMASHGLQVGDEDIIPFDGESKEARQRLIDVLESDGRPDGIFAHGDLSALLAIEVLKEKGIKIPEEMGIIGFGDSPFCSYLSPSLSSINQRNEDIGKLAASLLIDDIKQKDAKPSFHQHMLPPKLVARESSQRPK